MIIKSLTGGDVGPQLAGLEDIFLNPINYNILPYKNCYNEQHETVYTGFFIPAFSCMPIYMDSRGVTNTKQAMDHYMSIRKKKATTPKNLLEYSSEFCFYPQEALSRQGENDFDQVAIANQMATVKIMKELPDTYQKGNFKWVRDDNGQILRSMFIPNPNGKVIMVEPPETDEADQPLLNLYVAGVDSIDHGEDDSVVGDSGSKFCITIKKRLFGNKGDKYVCMYLERPKSVYTAYEIAAQMLFYYGCKANLEDTKIGFRMWLKSLNLDYKLLMKRPQSAQNSGKRNFNLWGTPGSEKMIRHGLELVSKYVEDSCYNIFIEEMLEQLQKFSYEAKGRFDIIMAMVYTEIADEDMMGITVRKENAISDQWNEFGDIGFVRDKYGNMQVGIISQM